MPQCRTRNSKTTTKGESISAYFVKNPETRQECDAIADGKQNLCQAKIIVLHESRVEPEVARKPLPHLVVIVQTDPHIPHQRQALTHLTLWAHVTQLKLFVASVLFHVVNHLATLRPQRAKSGGVQETAGKQIETNWGRSPRKMLDYLAQEPRDETCKFRAPSHTPDLVWSC